jgi:hypothetical protein
MLSSEWPRAPQIISAGVFLSSMDSPRIVNSLEIFDEILSEHGRTSVITPERELRLRKSSGVIRARSASLNSVVGAWLCKHILGQEVSASGLMQLAVFASSSSTATTSTFAFESRGLDEGWDSVDAMALPHTIPSSLASHIAMSIGSKGPAMVNVEGFLGVIQNFELAGDYLQDYEGARALVICAEEFGPVHKRIFDSLNLESPRYAGAVAWLLGFTDNEQLARISSVSRGSGTLPCALQANSDSDKHLKIAGTTGLGYMHSLDLPVAILRASVDGSSASIFGEHEGRGWGRINVERQ